MPDVHHPIPPLSFSDAESIPGNLKQMITCIQRTRIQNCRTLALKNLENTKDIKWPPTINHDRNKIQSLYKSSAVLRTICTFNKI